jgi:hypothetical protein
MCILVNGEMLFEVGRELVLPLKREEQKTKQAKNHQKNGTPPPVSCWDLQLHSLRNTQCAGEPQNVEIYNL